MSDDSVGARRAAPFPTYVDNMAARIKAGDRVALARGISLIEAGDADGLALAEATFAANGAAHVIGITGPPGAGKSTLTDTLIREYRTRDKTVAVLAIDPVSPRTGGATLGDRIRMGAAAGDSGVFVRSSAARGQAGGLALTTMQAARLMGAAGYDRVLVETVGTGQDGVAIADVAATTVLVQSPATGDEVQALKAGVLEIADIFVVNKADLPGANATARDLREVAAAAAHAGRWSPPVIATTATRGEGATALVDAIEAHRDHLAASGDGARRATERLYAEIRLLVQHEVRVVLDRFLAAPATVQSALDALTRRGMSPIAVARVLLQSRGWTPTRPD